jgi:SPASM domain peptide maturase of grasp-with-spasm system
MANFPSNIPFHLFASCIPVKGANRSAIYDLQRNQFEYIPNPLYDILTRFKNITFIDLLDFFPFKNDQRVLLEYFEFLKNNEFIFFSKLNSAQFPEYSISHERPYNISCLILDIENFHETKFEAIKRQILKAKVECIIFRFISPTTSIDIKNVLAFFNNIPTRIFQLFIENKNFTENLDFENLINLNERVSVIVKYNCEKELVQDLEKASLIHTKRDIVNNKMNINNIADFNVNMNLFMESQLYNSFYNKRVYIDSEGFIYRYEGDIMDFGNIINVELTNILENVEFKKYWHITKDEISVCKDCEYRYMCVDSSLPMSKTNNLWKLDRECNYNPYNSEWKSAYPTEDN